MIWPENFPDIAGWTFERTWAERPEWCKFALTWTKASGIFKDFQMFCRAKNKLEKCTEE